MRKGLFALFGAALVAAFSFASVSPAAAYSPANEDVAQILEDTNAARAQHGLPSLELNEQMTDVAQKWSQQQASEGKMYHNPDYSKQIPSGWSKAAENVAHGYSADTVTDGWMNSEAHRANILGDYTDVGIGVQDGYFTQVFAKYENQNTIPPATQEPAPKPSVPNETPSKKPSAKEVKPTPKPFIESSSKPIAKDSSEVAAGTEKPKVQRMEKIEDPETANNLVKVDSPKEKQSSRSDDMLVQLDELEKDSGEQEASEKEKEFNPWLVAILAVSTILLVGAIFALIRVTRRR